MAKKKQIPPAKSKPAPAKAKPGKASPPKSAKPAPKSPAKDARPSKPVSAPKAPKKSPKPAPPKPAPAKPKAEKPKPTKSAKPAPDLKSKIMAAVESKTLGGQSNLIEESAIVLDATIPADSVAAVLEADEPIGVPEAQVMDIGERAALESPTELEAALEAILFASPEPIPVKRISEALEGPDPKAVREALERLAAKYERRNGGMRVVEVQGGWRMGTHERHSEIIYRLGSRKKRQALSPATLETLAIIAYRQPIIRAQIETIRGVECSGTLRNLLDLGLIEITGYKEVIGRPAMYGTTSRFLSIFGLRSLADLPSIRGLKEQLKVREAEEAARELEARAKAESEARAQAEQAAQAMEAAGIIPAELAEESDDDEPNEGEVVEMDDMARERGDDASDEDDYGDEDDGDEYEDEDEDDEDSEEDDLDEDDEDDEFDDDDEEDDEDSDDDGDDDEDED